MRKRQSVSSVSEAKESDRYVIRAFLVLQRLQADLLQYAGNSATPSSPSSCPWARASSEKLPLEVKVNDHYQLGASIEYIAFERIVCGVAAPRGKCTRYLLLHDYWFMLVQPDVAAPKRAMVKTLFPIWQVETLVDRSDPRTMQIFVNAACARYQSEAAGAHTEPPPSQQETSPIILNFEDVRHCHNARLHVDGRRQNIRSDLMQKFIAHVNHSCDR